MITPLEFFLVYITCGFVGWMIDTSYRSAYDGKYTSNTYFPFFANIYAVGGAVLFINSRYVQSDTAYMIIGATSVIMLELAGGVFCKRILKKRFWNYSHNPLNWGGHIDALHSFYWIILTALARYVFSL